ncbi:MAG: helix-turn-helix domain-containing protein, partial [Porphyromonas sp.]
MSQLTAQQRYTIAQLLKQGKTQKEIALTIEKDKSVVSREIKRNSNKDGTYTATGAQMKADKRKRRLRSYRTFTSEMERIIKLFL